jgi:hypothetical protein
LGVDGAKAGRLETCPGCRTTFLVPHGSAAGAGAFKSARTEASAHSAPVPPLKQQDATAPPVPRLTLDDDEPTDQSSPPVLEEGGDPTYAVELEPAEPSPRQRPVPVPRRRRVPDGSDQTRRYTWGYGGDLLPGISNFALILIVLGLGLFLLAGLTCLVRPAVLLIIAVGALLLLGADIWMIILAFQDSSATGVLYLLLPYYRIIFALTNLEQTGPPLVVALIGVVYIVVGIGVFALAGKAGG